MKKKKKLWCNVAHCGSVCKFCSTRRRSMEFANRAHCSNVSLFAREGFYESERSIFSEIDAALFNKPIYRHWLVSSAYGLARLKFFSPRHGYIIENVRTRPALSGLNKVIHLSLNLTFSFLPRALILLSRPLYFFARRAHTRCLLPLAAFPVGFTVPFFSISPVFFAIAAQRTRGLSQGSTRYRRRVCISLLPLA